MADEQKDKESPNRKTGDRNAEVERKIDPKTSEPKRKDSESRNQ
jgi:hypothetical protein